MAAEMRIPAPNAVSASIWSSEKFVFFEIQMPRNVVPPANAVIAITRRTSATPMATIILLLS